MNEIPVPVEENSSRNGYKLHRNVWAVTFTSFLTDISSEMIFNLVPLFLFDVLKVKTPIIGLIDGIAETTASVMKVFSGALSDKLNKRKSLAVLGYGLSTISKPFFYLASTWGWVAGIRFADRLGKGIRTAPRDALVAGSVDEKHRGLAFGIHRAGDTAGAFLGLGLAALIIWLSQSSSVLLTRETFQKVVLISIIPAVLSVIVLMVMAVEITPQKKSVIPTFSLKGYDWRFKAFLLVSILFTLGNSSDAFITLRAQERGQNLLQILAMLMSFNAIYAILSGPIGALSDKIGRRRLILIGWLLYGLIYLGFALSRTGTGIWVLYSVYGIYYAFTEGTGKALIADLVPDENRGTAYGLYNAAIGLMALPASVVAGILWQGIGSWAGFGPSAPFYFGASMALLAGGLYIFLFRNEHVI